MRNRRTVIPNSQVITLRVAELNATLCFVTYMKILNNSLTCMGIDPLTVTRLCHCHTQAFWFGCHDDVKNIFLSFFITGRATGHATVLCLRTRRDWTMVICTREDVEILIVCTSFIYIIYIHMCKLLEYRSAPGGPYAPRGPFTSHQQLLSFLELMHIANAQGNKHRLYTI